VRSWAGPGTSAAVIECDQLIMIIKHELFVRLVGCTDCGWGQGAAGSQWNESGTV
jgi:hypothetical protein